MNSRAVVLALCGAAALAHSSVNGQAASQDDAAKAPAIPIIKVGTDLIQIDAAITDSKGRPIDDLRPEDFTVEIDGKKQAVANAQFFAMRSRATGANEPTATTESSNAQGPRSLIFLIDDLNMSFFSANHAKRALQAFAAEWDTREAFVAIRSTSDETGSVILSRKAERFDESIKKLRFNIRSNKMASSDPAYSSSMMGRDPDYLPTGFSGQAALARSNNSMLENESAFSNPAIVRANFEQRIYSLLTTVNSLRSVPGRKAVVFVSEGFDLFGTDRSLHHMGVDSPFDSLFRDQTVGAALRMITEVANRASVVVYTIDPSGLLAGGIGADAAYMPSRASVNMASLARFDAQGSLRQLADDTGGLSVYNRNDLKRGLVDVVTDQRSYYLVGFEPPKTAFAKNDGKPKFHSIKLIVNRKGARVRTRAGFYGVTDEEMVEKAPLMKTAEH